jgi:hypothetical protein
MPRRNSALLLERASDNVGDFVARRCASALGIGTHLVTQ